jgi:hypothetical protein
MVYAVEAMTGPDVTLLKFSPFGPQIKLSLSLITSSALLKLKVWDKAFKHLDTTQCDEEAIHALKLKRTFTFICFSIDTSRLEDETQWDNFKPQFESMMEDVEVIMRTRNSKPKRVFTLDGPVLVPLYFLATKCRYPILRRRAIALLKDEERQEGIWNSRAMAKVAERIMEIEEREGRGISGATVRFGMGERKAELNFLRMNENGPFDANGITVAKEVLEW